MEPQLKSTVKSNKYCIISGCNRKHYGRGWCEMHYKRNARHGDPVKKLNSCSPRGLGFIQRFESKFEKTEGCWVWADKTNNSGYADFKYNGHKIGAHRLSYELYVGLIPRDLEIDHICRNRKCVNPKHLEPVTHRENLIRGIISRKKKETTCQI